MTPATLPPAVAAALADPQPGQRITVEAAGIPWSAIVWGDPAARPLLLIHGVTSSAAGWWRIGPALAATGRRVVAVDQAGHGLTGHWQGHFRFRDNAADIAAFIREASLDRPDLQLIGHSWGATTAAALPAVGIRPATLILLDPPVLPLAVISLEASDPAQQTYRDIDEAIAAVRRSQPEWSDGDVRAKAESLTTLDEGAARAVLLENGDWDGGLAELRDPAGAGIDTWLVRGEPATGGYVSEDAAAAFEAVIGRGHVLTIAGGSHSPQRLHPAETIAAFLRALNPA